jgi:hypothetical protein
MTLDHAIPSIQVPFYILPHFPHPNRSCRLPQTTKDQQGTRKDTLRFSCANRLFQAYPQRYVAPVKPSLGNCREGRAPIPDIDAPQQGRHLYDCHPRHAYPCTGLYPSCTHGMQSGGCKSVGLAQVASPPYVCRDPP